MPDHLPYTFEAAPRRLEAALAEHPERNFNIGDLFDQVHALEAGPVQAATDEAGDALAFLATAGLARQDGRNWLSTPAIHELLRAASQPDHDALMRILAAHPLVDAFLDFLDAHRRRFGQADQRVLPPFATSMLWDLAEIGRRAIWLHRGDSDLLKICHPTPPPWRIAHALGLTQALFRSSLMGERPNEWLWRLVPGSDPERAPVPVGVHLYALSMAFGLHPLVAREAIREVAEEGAVVFSWHDPAPAISLVDKRRRHYTLDLKDGRPVALDHEAPGFLPGSSATACTVQIPGFDYSPALLPPWEPPPKAG